MMKFARWNGFTRVSSALRPLAIGAGLACALLGCADNSLSPAGDASADLQAKLPTLTSDDGLEIRLKLATDGARPGRINAAISRGGQRMELGCGVGFVVGATAEDVTLIACSAEEDFSVLADLNDEDPAEFYFRLRFDPSDANHATVETYDPSFYNAPMPVEEQFANVAEGRLLRSILGNASAVTVSPAPEGAETAALSFVFATQTLVKSLLGETVAVRPAAKSIEHVWARYYDGLSINIQTGESAFTRFGSAHVGLGVVRNDSIRLVRPEAFKRDAVTKLANQ